MTSDKNAKCEINFPLIVSPFSTCLYDTQFYRAQKIELKKNLF